MDYNLALPIAQALLERLRPLCERIEIAGSLRRRKPEVKDIELVAVPILEQVYQEDLFGDQVGVDETMPLDAWLADVSAAGEIDLSKSGPRYKRFVLLQSDIAVDLFLVRPPATWGVILALRTGPADFSKWLVSTRPAGALPFGYKVDEGQLWDGDQVIPTPEEQDLFTALGLPWTPPEQRAALWRSS